MRRANSKCLARSITKALQSSVQGSQWSKLQMSWTGKCWLSGGRPGCSLGPCTHPHSPHHHTPSTGLCSPGSCSMLIAHPSIIPGQGLQGIAGDKAGCRVQGCNDSTLHAPCHLNCFGHLTIGLSPLPVVQGAEESWHPSCKSLNSGVPSTATGNLSAPLIHVLLSTGLG